MSGSSFNVTFSASPLSVTAGSKNSTSATVTIADLHNQIPPAGTTIQVSTGNGALQSPASYTVANTDVNSPFSFNLTVAGDGTSSSGLITVTVTTPKGVVSYGFVNFSD